MIQEKLVKDLIEERIAGTELYLVNLNITHDNRIKVEIDSDQGVSIDDCVAISRQIEHNLDREQEDFELNVSSPGLDQPFKVKRQYKKNIGREIRLRTTDHNEHKGKLIHADEDKIELKIKKKQKVEGKKKKIMVEETLPFTYDQIKEAKVVITFNK